MYLDRCDTCFWKYITFPPALKHFKPALLIFSSSFTVPFANNYEEKAEAILFGVAQKMIANLGSQIFQEIGSLWGIKDELEKIKNTISIIQAVLLDAAEQQNHNHQLRDWLVKLKDAVYEADDLLGELSLLHRSFTTKSCEWE